MITGDVEARLVEALRQVAPDAAEGDLRQWAWVIRVTSEAMGLTSEAVGLRPPTATIKAQVTRLKAALDEAEAALKDMSFYALTTLDLDKNTLKTLSRAHSAWYLQNRYESLSAALAEPHIPVALGQPRKPGAAAAADAVAEVFRQLTGVEPSITRPPAGGSGSGRALDLAKEVFNALGFPKSVSPESQLRAAIERRAKRENGPPKRR